ncbi:F-box protein At5g07610 [Setaria viridis]|uniref:F-box domain-containing protein n=1 Tax=Setaria viridis TaxID=4556 RepID=A0A4U6T1L9_SETVI|nr:F-box protein At5g07610-like [Setaria viridis]TKV95399.1 hypothetical protein SEVIR_9G360600v2 [Setaria viridis]
MGPSKKCASAAADLTDDLIVEILSRLPAKSICRFKCVSWHWYNLITRPEHRKKIPQTLSGFFYPTCRLGQENDVLTFPDFVDIMGEEELPFSDPPLSFLTGYRLIDPKICCNGLLLCLCWKVSPSDKANYVVCNPATEKWVALPESNHDSDACAHYLGFDPAASSHFHVFQLLEEDEDYGYTVRVNISIYSSERGAWSHKGNIWSSELKVDDSKGVFLNGMLHLMIYDFKILAVDTEGKTWRTIPLLETMRVENPFGAPLSFIGQSQGRLYYINMRDVNTSILLVWILEDYDSGEWICKYSISASQLFGKKGLRFEQDYFFIGIHPDCNLIYFVLRCEDMLMSYDMYHGKVSVICSLKEHLRDSFIPYLPYVPFLSDSVADQG